MSEQAVNSFSKNPTNNVSDSDSSDDETPTSQSYIDAEKRIFSKELQIKNEPGMKNLSNLRNIFFSCCCLQ